MKPKLRVALAQYASVVGNAPATVAKACRLIELGASQGADLVLLPEYSNTEYFAQHRDYRYLDYAEHDDGPSISRIRQSARDLGVFVAANFYENAGGGHLYNTTALIDRGGAIVGKYRKTHPAAIKSLEKIYFRYGSQFPVFPVDGWRVGVITSDDNFYPEATRCAALAGADVILMPHAVIRGILWEPLFQTRAFENSVYICIANKIGVEQAFDFCGRSLAVDPFGTVLLVTDDSTEGAQCATLEIDNVYEARKRFHLYRDRRPDLYQRLVQETDTFGRQDG
jgi:N-carbamoylputrescine amidase